MPKTHEGWRNGSGVCWEPVPGNRLRLYGWSHRHCELNVGDYLILKPNGEERTTRYRLTEVRRPGDPPDMWLGTAEFAPRAERAP